MSERMPEMATIHDPLLREQIKDSIEAKLQALTIVSRRDAEQQGGKPLTRPYFVHRVAQARALLAVFDDFRGCPHVLIAVKVDKGNGIELWRK